MDDAHTRLWARLQLFKNAAASAVDCDTLLADTLPVLREAARPISDVVVKLGMRRIGAGVLCHSAQGVGWGGSGGSRHSRSSEMEVTEQWWTL